MEWRPLKAWVGERDSLDNEEDGVPEHRSRFFGELVRVDESPNLARGREFQCLSDSVDVEVTRELGDTTFVEEDGWSTVKLQRSGEPECKAPHEEPE